MVVVLRKEREAKLQKLQKKQTSGFTGICRENYVGMYFDLFGFGNVFLCLSDSERTRVSHLTHQLGVDLGDTVNGTWSLHTHIRGGVPG